jgi:hypothetical protein
MEGGLMVRRSPWRWGDGEELGDGGELDDNVDRRSLAAKV